MTTQALERVKFRTPAGNRAVFSVRPETSDWNTCNAITAVGNEYHLPRGLSGWALDVGAHIGACTVALLLDNPDLRVVAIEALPENVALLHENLRLNGVEDRCIVIEGAASHGQKVRIAYSDDPHHRFIGSATPVQRDVDDGRQAFWARGVDIVEAIDATGDYSDDAGFAWCKTDCEGGEYEFFDHPAVAGIRLIEGEVHHGWDRLVAILSPTHDVTGDGKDFGAFRAVRR